MNKYSEPTRSAPQKASRANTYFAAVAFVVGIIVLFVSIAVDQDGFWGGMLLGSSIALMVVGAYAAGMGAGMRRTNSATSGAWLPSQDPTR